MVWRVSNTGAVHTGAFAANTNYTAFITLSTRNNHTLLGVPDNFFIVQGAITALFEANTNLIIAYFPPPVNPVIQLPAPYPGNTAFYNVNTSQYTGTLDWFPPIPSNGKFENTYYFLTITLKPIAPFGWGLKKNEDLVHPFQVYLHNF